MGSRADIQLLAPPLVSVELASRAHLRLPLISDALMRFLIGDLSASASIPQLALSMTEYLCVCVCVCVYVCVCRALHQAVPNARILITRVGLRLHIYEFFQPLRVPKYTRLIQSTFKVNGEGYIFESATTLPNPYLLLKVP